MRPGNRTFAEEEVMELERAVRRARDCSEIGNGRGNDRCHPEDHEACLKRFTNRVRKLRGQDRDRYGRIWDAK